MKPFNFSGVIEDPNKTIPTGYYGNLTSNSTLSWKTRTCSINMETNSFFLTLDNGNGNEFNYNGVISGKGGIRLIGASQTSTVGLPIKFGGTLPNTYAGYTFCQRGKIVLAKPDGVISLPSQLITIFNGGNNDELLWMSSDQINNNARINVISKQCKLTLGKNSEKIKELVLAIGSKIYVDSLGLLYVNSFTYGTTKYSDGIYTQTTSPTFIAGDGKLVVSSDDSISYGSNSGTNSGGTGGSSGGNTNAGGESNIQPVSDVLPTPTVYKSFNRDTLILYPYTGKHIALLVTKEYYITSVLKKIVDGIDKAYEYYSLATGREPSKWNQCMYNGLATIACVPSTCGAGCGNLGTVGIELQADYFKVLFDGVKNLNKFDQAVFYELGRNFWFYGNKIEYVDTDAVANITTGYAVFMRFMAMEYAGLDGANFGSRTFTQFRTDVEGIFPNMYLTNPKLNWENTFKIGISPSGGITDLFASLMFYLRKLYGNDFILKIWKEIDKQSNRLTTSDAVNNFINAVSIVSGKNAKILFSTFRFRHEKPMQKQTCTKAREIRN